jgi:hypothetical protein
MAVGMFCDLLLWQKCFCVFVTTQKCDSKVTGLRKINAILAIATNIQLFPWIVDNLYKQLAGRAIYMTT